MPAVKWVVSPARVARGAVVVALVAVVAGSASCAYYNTFYLARKYYMKATDGQPYEVDREGTAQRSNYTKSADYSKKVLGVHPKSKWVDDAWLMWAKTFVGTDDPLKAVAMLEEFEARFPKSDLRPDAEFFLGLSLRSARRYEGAVDRFDNFLRQAPKHELAPYAWYERSKAMLALKRYGDAAESAGQILSRYPKHVLADRALRQRAEARFQQRDFTGARKDFAAIGDRALTDDDRMRYMLREVDCLEEAREYREALAVLEDARAHVPAPPPPPEVQRVGPAAGAAGTAPPPPIRPPVPGQEKYGKLTLRMGGVELLAGRVNEAVRHFESVLRDYPRSQLAGEAQYRIGFAYETGAYDFERARSEYQKVREQAGTSQFSQQAQQRLENLDRIERFRTASGADSAARQAESRFLTAEHYVFNLDRPERAVEEYRAIADSSSDSAVIARALTAEAWVLSRKLDRKKSADSLLWKVVREYPGTEAQLAARDYLEASGQTVPANLIKAPEATSKPLFEAEMALTAPLPGTPRLGTTSQSTAMRNGPSYGSPRPSTNSDSLRAVLTMRDSLTSLYRQDTTVAGRARLDSLRQSFFVADTTGRAAQLAAIQRSTPKPEGVVVAQGGGTAPNLNAGADAQRVSPPTGPSASSAPLPNDRGVDGLAAGATTGYALTPSDSASRAGSAATSTSGAPRTTPPRPTSGAAAAAATTAPAKPASRSITSFEKKDRATREREKQERLREKAVKDSTRRAKATADKAAKAVRDSTERAKAAAEKAAKAAKGKPAAPPPTGTAPAGGAASAARPDSSSSDRP